MSQRKQETDWLAEGQNALLDLLSERLVIPWFEAESRISSKSSPFSYTNPENPLPTLVKSLKNVPLTLSLSSPYAYPSHLIEEKKLPAFVDADANYIGNTFRGLTMKGFVADMPSELF